MVQRTALLQERPATKEGWDDERDRPGAVQRWADERRSEGAKDQIEVGAGTEIDVYEEDEICPEKQKLLQRG